MSPFALKDAIQTALHTHLSEVTDFTATLSELIRPLPERMRHWAIGEELISRAIVLGSWRGDLAHDDSWLELFGARESNHSEPSEFCAMFPNSESFVRSAAGSRSHLTRVGRQYRRSRALISGHLPADPDCQLSEYFDSGGDARTRPNLPVFLCVDSDSHVAIAAGTNTSHPSEIVLLRSPLVAGVALELFNMHWATGRTLAHRRSQHEWSPLLKMLYRGETLESASRRLSFTPRTARRRLDAAYEHYGVDTLFALGTAWGADVAEAAPLPQDEGEGL